MLPAIATDIGSRARRDMSRPPIHAVRGSCSEPATLRERIPADPGSVPYSLKFPLWPYHGAGSEVCGFFPSFFDLLDLFGVSIFFILFRGRI